MLNLKRIFKGYEETGSLNAMVNLFGFISPHVFLTKSGDAGIVLELQGVDYECLDDPAIDHHPVRPVDREEPTVPGGEQFSTALNAEGNLSCPRNAIYRARLHRSLD